MTLRQKHSDDTNALRGVRHPQRRNSVEELTLLVGRTQRDVTELVGAFAKGYEDAIDFNNAYPDAFSGLRRVGASLSWAISSQPRDQLRVIPHSSAGPS